MTENKPNRYDIILNLKELNKQLLQCTTYDEVDDCRYQLLSFIENTPRLKSIYQDVIAQEETLKRGGEFNTCINRIHLFIINLLNFHTRYRTFTLSRQKRFLSNHLETVSFIENNEITYQFVDCPSLIYYPSLTIFLPPTNYLNLRKYNKPITDLGDLYSFLDFTETVQSGLLLMTLKYNFEYFILNKDLFNIGLQENNFNAAYLRCIVYSVNKSLQEKLRNDKIDTTAKRDTSNVEQSNNSTNYTLTYKNDIYYLNGNDLRLTHTEKIILTSIINLKKTTPKQCKNMKSRINKKSEKFGISLIELNHGAKKDNFYILNPKIRQYNL